jgi:glutamine cyclotransferase
MVLNMMNRVLRNICLLVLLVNLLACEKEKKNEIAQGKDPLAITYKLRASWRHDPSAWIQGLLIHNGKLYESTGQQQSWIGIVDIETGKPDKKVILDNKYFGEGITILNNKIYQLTWQNKTGFIYDLTSFKKLGEFTYNTEGWGLTHDKHNLIMSDGSEKISYLDTVSLKPVKTITVTDEVGPVKKLNELEYVEGFIFANVWETNRIVKIDPANGKVVGRLDLSALAQSAALQSSKIDVLNGIAYHPGTKMLVVTGKLWPTFYVLQLNQ